LCLGVPELGAIPSAACVGLNGSGWFAPRLSRNAQRPLTLNLQRAEIEIARAMTHYPLAAWSTDAAVLADSFRATVASILFAGQNGDRPRVLLFASPHPQEGKSAALCNVAVALARIGRRVAVVDGDLRNPTLHRIFGVTGAHGLSNLLTVGTSIRVAISEAIHPTQFNNLSVVPYGSGAYPSPETLHSLRMSQVMGLLRAEFDLVLVDSPPVLEVPDARVLGRLADAVILVVRANVTERTSAVAARQRFAEDGTPVLGTILNAWDSRRGPGYPYDVYVRSPRNGINQMPASENPETGEGHTSNVPRI
jgi:capsular exopolysaccharide synthesis family protein